MNERAAIMMPFSVLLLAVVALVSTAAAQRPVKDATDAFDSRACLARRSCPTQLQAAYRLAERKDFPFLLHLYPKAPSDTQEWIVQGIYASMLGRDDPRVQSFMRGVASQSTQEEDVSETKWYALQFLAESCDATALKTLRAHGGDEHTPYAFKVACGEWAKTLEIFGKCKYVPAKEVLLDSLNSSCLDVANSAAASLDILYPQACPQKSPFSEAKHCYIDLWSKEK